MLHILFQSYPWGPAIRKKDRVTRPLVHGSGPLRTGPRTPPYLGSPFTEKDNNKNDNNKKTIIKMTIRDLTYHLFCFDWFFFVIVASLTVAMKGGPAYFEKDR